MMVLLIVLLILILGTVFIIAHYNSQEKFGGIVTPSKKRFKDTMEEWLYNHALFTTEISTLN